MAQYNGSIELISGIKQANDGNFPLVEASAIQVDDVGKRLNVVLTELDEKIDNIDVSDIDTYTRTEIDEKIGNIISSGVDISEEELNNMLIEVLGE